MASGPTTRRKIATAAMLGVFLLVAAVVTASLTMGASALASGSRPVVELGAGTSAVTEPAPTTTVAPAVAPPTSSSPALRGTTGQAAPKAKAPTATARKAPTRPAPARPAAPRPAAPTTKAPAPKPAGPPGGNPSSYRFTSVDATGRPTRWDPCSSIRWAFNPDQAPAGALDLAKGAFDRLSAASGLSFLYSGTTTFKPLKDSGGSPPAGIDAVIAFGNATEYSDFSDGTFGIGGFTSTGTAEGGRIIRGGVVLNSAAVTRAPDGFGSGQRRGGALLHELGHMVGLDHVSDASQIMNPALTTSAPSDYAAGDRTGLTKVGAPAGCFVVPAA